MPILIRPSNDNGFVSNLKFVDHELKRLKHSLEYGLKGGQHANLIRHDGPSIAFLKLSNGLTDQGDCVLASESSSSASLFGLVSWTSSLLFTPPTIVVSKFVVVPLEEIVAQGVKVWENSLVGKTIDGRMPYVAIQRLIEKIWDKN